MEARREYYAQTERPAQHDLIAVLRLIDWRAIRLRLATGQVTAAGARSIAESLHDGDFCPLDEVLGTLSKEVIGPIKAFAWPLILQSAGLVTLAGDRLQRTETGKKALVAPPHGTLRRAWVHWQETTLPDELKRIETIKGQTGSGLTTRHSLRSCSSFRVQRPPISRSGRFRVCHQ